MAVAMRRFGRDVSLSQALELSVADGATRPSKSDNAEFLTFAGKVRSRFVTAAAGLNEKVKPAELFSTDDIIGYFCQRGFVRPPRGEGLYCMGRPDVARDPVMTPAMSDALATAAAWRTGPEDEDTVGDGGNGASTMV